MDSFDGNKKVTAEEFKVALSEIGCVGSKAEFDSLMKLLDTDGDGNINFDEFLIGVRVSIKLKPTNVAEKAAAGELSVIDKKKMFRVNQMLSARL